MDPSTKNKSNGEVRCRILKIKGISELIAINYRTFIKFINQHYFTFIDLVNLAVKSKTHMRYIVPFIALSFLILLSCDSSSTPETPTEVSNPTLLGEWELSKEIVNGKTLDCSAEEIKTIISFKGEGYFIYFDDLSNSGIGTKVAKIQTHYKGQYEVDGETLTLSYTDDSKDFEDVYTIKSTSDTQLVLVNSKSSKETHYTKR